MSWVTAASGFFDGGISLTNNETNSAYVNLSGKISGLSIRTSFVSGYDNLPVQAAPNRYDFNVIDASAEYSWQVGKICTLQKALPYLNDNPSVIIMTSWLNSIGFAGSSLLSASKAALRSLVRVASAELVARGIRVNAVSPGAIRTPLWGKEQFNFINQYLTELKLGLARIVRVLLPLNAH